MVPRARNPHSVVDIPLCSFHGSSRERWRVLRPTLEKWRYENVDKPLSTWYKSCKLYISCLLLLEGTITLRVVRVICITDVAPRDPSLLMPAVQSLEALSVLG